MKKVTIIFAIDENKKDIIGVAETVDGAIQLIKSSGYDMTDQERLLVTRGFTTNLKVNFKLETWQVH